MSASKQRRQAGSAGEDSPELVPDNENGKAVTPTKGHPFVGPSSFPSGFSQTTSATFYARPKLGDLAVWIDFGLATRHPSGSEEGIGADTASYYRLAVLRELRAFLDAQITKSIVDERGADMSPIERKA